MEDRNFKMLKKGNLMEENSANEKEKVNCKFKEGEKERSNIDINQNVKTYNRLQNTKFEIKNGNDLNELNFSETNENGLNRKSAHEFNFNDLNDTNIENDDELNVKYLIVNDLTTNSELNIKNETNITNANDSNTYELDGSEINVKAVNNDLNIKNVNGTHVTLNNNDIKRPDEKRIARNYTDSIGNIGISDQMNAQKNHISNIEDKNEFININQNDHMILNLPERINVCTSKVGLLESKGSQLSSTKVIEISDSDSSTSAAQIKMKIHKKVENRPKKQFLCKDDIKTYLRTLRDEVIIIKRNKVVFYDDFRRLNPYRWLNDKIINFYFQLIGECAERLGRRIFIFSTFFYTKLSRGGVEGVISWIDGYRENSDIDDRRFKNCETRENSNIVLLNYDCLFIPIHLSNHWIFVCVDINNSTIEMYDSLQHTNSAVIYKIRNFLVQISNHQSARKWKILIRHDIPTQTNGNDCGVYVCIYARFRIVSLKMNFSSHEVCDFRRKIAHEISVGEIIYFLNHRFRD